MVKRWHLVNECPNCFMDVNGSGAFTQHTDYESLAKDYLAVNERGKLMYDKITQLEQENARLRAALQRIVDGIPAYHEGSFVTLHHDGDGNEMGFEHHDPFAIIQSIVGVAESALQAQP